MRADQNKMIKIKNIYILNHKYKMAKPAGDDSAKKCAYTYYKTLNTLKSKQILE